MNRLDEILELLNKLSDEVEELKLKEISEDTSTAKHWSETTDLLKIEGESGEWIEVECNFDSWNYAKDKKYPLLIDVYENEYTSCCTALKLEQMKQLRDYLDDKIKFLEHKDIGELLSIDEEDLRWI